jgi:hypothetical protein
MRRSAFLAATLAALALAAGPALAFEAVTDRAEFVQLVEGRALKRLGISLTVTPDGAIRGRAFGTDVTGAWRWDDGYFCRDLAYGSRALGQNCQLVQQNGRTLRFVSDRGRGEYADLRLE